MELKDLHFIKGEETFTFFASPYQSFHFIPLLRILLLLASLCICTPFSREGIPWRDFSVLCYDVLIADERVAPVWFLGVKISSAFSLCSSTGCAEFAKRLEVDELRRDLSPVSVRCLMNSFSPLGLARQYDIKRFSTFCRIGYRSLSCLRSRTTERRFWIFNKIRLPVSWWLGRGKPLNPYLTGLLVHILRDNKKPKD